MTAVAPTRSDAMGTVYAVAALVRIRTVLAASVLCLVGIRLAGGGTGARVAAAVVAIACCVAFAQVVNDVADVDVDRRGKPHRPLPAGLLAVGSARRIAAGLAVAALAVAATLGPALLTAHAVLLAASWAYSRWWKGTVLLGNAVVALLSSTPVVLGAAAAGRVDALVLAVQLVVLVFMAAFEVVKTGIDRDDDAAAGLRTVATVAGVRTTALVGAGLATAFVLVAALPATLSEHGAAYLAVLVPTGALPTLAAAVMLVRDGRTPAALRPPFRLLRWAWLGGIVAMVLL